MPMTFKPTGYVPPPPKNTVTIPKPPVNANAKTFPVSTGKSPWMLDLPGIQRDEKPEMPEVQEGSAAGGAPADDGFTPEQRRKM